MNKSKKKSTIQWIAEFADTHKSKYIASVITATIGVLCGLVISYQSCHLAMYWIPLPVP